MVCFETTLLNRKSAQGKQANERKRDISAHGLWCPVGKFTVYIFGLRLYRRYVLKVKLQLVFVHYVAASAVFDRKANLGAKLAIRDVGGRLR